MISFASVCLVLLSLLGNAKANGKPTGKLVALFMLVTGTFVPLPVFSFKRTTINAIYTENHPVRRVFFV